MKHTPMTTCMSKFFRYFPLGVFVNSLERQQFYISCFSTSVQSGATFHPMLLMVGLAPDSAVSLLRLIALNDEESGNRFLCWDLVVLVFRFHSQIDWISTLPSPACLHPPYYPISIYIPSLFYLITATPGNTVPRITRGGTFRPKKWSKSHVPRIARGSIFRLFRSGGT